MENPCKGCPEVDCYIACKPYLDYVNEQIEMRKQNANHNEDSIEDSL